jgi:hypothetical protein
MDSFRDWSDDTTDLPTIKKRKKEIVSTPERERGR